MNNTPETDEHIWVYAEYDNRKLVDAEFDRKLEGERDRFQEQVDELIDRLGVTQERMIDAERERDTLKKHTSIMDISHKIANDEYFKLAVENENLERERDRWKAEAERWREINK